MYYGTQPEFAIDLGHLNIAWGKASNVMRARTWPGIPEPRPQADYDDDPLTTST